MKVAVVGLGIMGSAMAKRLLEANHEVTVYNRTRDKAQSLLSAGATWSDTPADAASRVDVIITMVTDPKAVNDVTLGDTGVLAGISPGAVHSEMSTVAPQSAAELAQEYARRGRRFVQTPVVGGGKQIQQSTLLAIAGGNTGDIDHCRNVWSAFTKNVWTVETAEQASAMKLACNMLLANLILGLGQSLSFARLYGISPRELLDVLSNSAMAAPQFAAKGESILKGEFPPAFTVSNLLKDLTLSADAARTRGWSMPLNAVAREVFTMAVTAGYNDQDYAASVKVLADQAGVDLTEAR